jgi:predicted DNA-binding protein (MmcQ/YjbR family)
LNTTRSRAGTRLLDKSPRGRSLSSRSAEPLPSDHLDKRHWNTVLLDGSLPEQLVRDMIEDSYDLVVSGLPPARRRALGWEPDRK